MLEGLEVSVLKFKDVIADSIHFRLDSEYFEKSFLLNEAKIFNTPTKKIIEISKVSDGDHSKFPENQNQEIKYLQAKDIKNCFLNESDVFISRDYFNKNVRSQIFEENILMSIMGSVGDITITPKGFAPSLANRAVAILKDIENINPYFLFTYLTTLSASLQIERHKNGGVQERINLELLGTIRVPIYSTIFQLKIEEIVITAQENFKESKTNYYRAEQLLLRELGIDNINWQQKGLATNDKTFKESFADSGRLDAEYYQPKYDIIQNHLKQFEQIKLKDLVSTPITSGSTPKAGDSQYYTDASDGIPFIRAVDIGNNRVSLDDLNYIRRNVHEGILKKTQLKHNDVLFSIAGTVGRCGIFDHDVEANINQACAILRFNEDIINRLYLIIFFNSEVGQQIIEKYARQGVQTNLNMDEIGNLQIPILENDTQQQIASLIQQSFQLRKQSKHLLDIAKQAVEMAIETDETTAMAFIKANTE